MSVLSSNEQTLVEKWNGSSWKLVNSPNTSSSQYDFFGGVSCVSTSFCIATGDDYNGYDQTLIGRW